jgi:hypothetical protein
MSTVSRQVGALRSIVAGASLTTIVGFSLLFFQVPLALALGAFAGGILAGRIGGRRQVHAAGLGAASGLVSVLAIEAVGRLIILLQLLPPPEVPGEVDAVAALEILIIPILLQMVSGAGGAVLGYYLRGRRKQRTTTEPTAQGPTKTCVQCGADIGADLQVCPFCRGVQSNEG